MSGPFGLAARELCRLDLAKLPLEGDDGMLDVRKLGRSTRITTASMDRFVTGA